MNKATKPCDVGATTSPEWNNRNIQRGKWRVVNAFVGTDLWTIPEMLHKLWPAFCYPKRALLKKKQNPLSEI
jgi:hypothetical protein